MVSTKHFLGERSRTHQIGRTCRWWAIVCSCRMFWYEKDHGWCGLPRFLQTQVGLFYFGLFYVRRGIFCQPIWERLHKFLRWLRGQFFLVCSVWFVKLSHSIHVVVWISFMRVLWLGWTLSSWLLSVDGWIPLMRIARWVDRYLFWSFKYFS